jgi:hypothetical protein
MTDEQINLPPLPVAYNVMGDPLHNNFHAGHMKDYARAAVLADRAAHDKDAERLDWLDKQCSENPRTFVACLPGALRAAIDAAMEKDK